MAHLRVYLAAAMRGIRGNLEHTRIILSELKKRGFEVLTEGWIADEVLDVDKGLSPKEIFQRDIDALNRADAVVADVSFPSLGVGFEIAYALLKGKRVIAYCRKDRRDSISALIEGITWPGFELIEYDDPEELVEVITRKLKGNGNR